VATIDDVAALALRLPDVTEAERHGNRTWYVARKGPSSRRTTLTLGSRRNSRPPSRLRRNRARYLERYGQAAYDMMLGDACGTCTP